MYDKPLPEPEPSLNSTDLAPKNMHLDGEKEHSSRLGDVVCIMYDKPLTKPEPK